MIGISHFVTQILIKLFFHPGWNVKDIVKKRQTCCQGNGGEPVFTQEEKHHTVAFSPGIRSGGFSITLTGNCCVVAMGMTINPCIFNVLFLCIKSVVEVYPHTHTTLVKHVYFTYIIPGADNHGSIPHTGNSVVVHKNHEYEYLGIRYFCTANIFESLLNTAMCILNKDCTLFAPLALGVLNSKLILGNHLSNSNIHALKQT